MADILVARRTAQTIAIRDPAGNAASIAAWVLSAAAMVLVLLLPTLWNGFPLIFPDTGGYLGRPFEGVLAMGRSALYGLFLVGGIPLAFWPNVIAQAALIVWLIVLTLSAHGLGGRPWLALGIVVMLSVGTSLPWFAGQLMPDILFPAAVLALNLLVFRGEILKRAERYSLAAVVAVAVASHMAVLGLCVALVSALWLLSRSGAFKLPRPRLPFASGAVGAGVALSLLSNLAIAGSFAFTPGGSSFLFGRLLEDGIVARYLDDRCPDPALRLCKYRDDLPNQADDWLWGYGSPFYKLGGPAGYAGEERKIIGDTLLRYPLMHASTAIVATVEQFRSFETEISVDDNAPTFETLAEHAPQLLPRVMAARQQTENFDLDPLNLLHVPLAALAMAGLALAVILRRRLNIAPEAVALCLTVLLAFAANAAISGIFSHPVDRYQSRLAPLAPFAVTLLIAGRRREPQPG